MQFNELEKKKKKNSDYLASTSHLDYVFTTETNADLLKTFKTASKMIILYRWH